MPQTSELKPDYYLDNFFILIHHAKLWYDDLLTLEEQHWLVAFTALSPGAQALLVRMLSRKGTLFRSDKLKYVEIGEIQPLLVELVDANFIALNPIQDNEQIGKLLTKAELLTQFPHLHRSDTKPNLLAQIAGENFTQYSALPFTIIELYSPDIITRLLALFFANTHQDLSQFVLSDIGIHSFETYPLSRSLRFFQHRDELDMLLALEAWYTEYQNSAPLSLDALNSLRHALPPKTHHYELNRKRQRAINTLARDYERLGHFDLALSLFQQTALPPSRERQVRILLKQSKLAPQPNLSHTTLSDDVESPLAQAKSIIEQMLKSPYDIDEYDVANRMKKTTSGGKKATPNLNYSQKTIALDLSSQRVELMAKQWLEADGYEVFYCENHLLTGLLGLAIWPEIYAPVEGAFVNRYQRAPRDLFRPEFVHRREQALQRRLQSLSGKGIEQIIERYQEKQGISNALVNWSHLSLTLIERALEHIPPDTLIGLFQQMLSDLRHYRTGMPDLIAFKEGQFRWIEVKGPGDKLQHNQLRWIAVTRKLNINIEVLYVTALDAQTI
ncbi:VRR-NUC domain-containing protein [Vibrio sp. SM6]|uniref:phosphodiesterase I n=1 Tax=Vibrio agarilyticus TaxID=2726741 RepID=A0A7X8TSH4_9VIBR|nr:VRR-NUC domain-containing protein [Vibrio agarilyticus]NLS13453.1 VRR-NUC domain-containing protein [Vibrio agarilyticus]